MQKATKVNFLDKISDIPSILKLIAKYINILIKDLLNLKIR